jgi:hypothetical protein
MVKEAGVLFYHRCTILVNLCKWDNFGNNPGDKTVHKYVFRSSKAFHILSDTSAIQ